jgi:DNA polymerase-3 subunit epsilon/ATP-dependent DNA helicase DinG
VKPSVEIPARITTLTGISQEDVDTAPTLQEILPDLRNFIGQFPLLGHNISFDVGFLQKHGLALHNPTLDTYELASVLMPTAPRYNLTSLSEQLGSSDLTDAHRALSDTIATCNIYWILWNKLLNLPLNVLQEIVNASAGMNWEARLPFEAALAIRVKTAMVSGEDLSFDEPFEASTDEWELLRPNAEYQLLDADELAAIIEPGGLIENIIPGYESRQSQVRMLKTVTNALSSEQHLIIEAPTGTGKSIAYAIPAIYWAAANNERVVISTATIALQDQLIRQDIPLLQEVLGIDFKAAVMKGRSNYLCPRRLRTLRRRPPTSIEELRVLAKILVWLQEEGASGDKGDISLRGGAEQITWVRLSAQDEGCTRGRCESQMHGACPFYKARRAAEAAHIIIVNHSLLLSDVTIGNRVLPDYRYLIIDEAHHLEDATTNGLSTRLDRNSLRRRFADLGDNQKGMLGDLLAATKDKIPARYYNQMAEYVAMVASAVKQMEFHVDAYFNQLLGFVRSNARRSDFMPSLRITDNMRENRNWLQIQERWDGLKEFTQTISKAMNTIVKGLKSLESYNIDDFDDLVSSVQTAARHLQAIHEQLDAFTTIPADNTIYWCEVSQDNRNLTINAAPLHVGPLIKKHLWDAKNSAVLTSATMSIANSFHFIRDRLSAETHEVDELTVESPFDYRSSTLVYIPTDIPEPNDRQRYQLMAERGIIELATALDGRLLGLFTSYEQLRQTAQNITPRLALGGISVYDQSSGSSRQLLIENFKTSEKAVLLGTRSFWEGVDLPGEDLQALVIARLPFAVPSDPIFAARSETFENSFMEYAVPEAVLRFRQGFGRLIRRRTDRGVVAVFDRRIISKRYGQAFLDSLPDCEVMRGPLSKLPEVARRWMEGS